MRGDRCEAVHHVYEPPQDGVTNHYDLRCIGQFGHAGHHVDVFSERWGWAAHIATFDPPTVLKLLAVVEAARKVSNQLGLKGSGDAAGEWRREYVAELRAALAALTEEGE